jgi:hypothetical protein
MRYSAGSDHPALRHIIYSIRCRFDAVVDEVKQSMNVANVPQLNFVRDDDSGLELALS